MNIRCEAVLKKRQKDISELLRITKQLMSIGEVKEKGEEEQIIDERISKNAIRDRYYTEFKEDKEMRELYIEALEDLINCAKQFKEYFEKEQYEELSKLAHNKKSSLGSLKLSHFYEILVKVEENIRVKNYRELKELIEKLEQMISEIPAEIIRGKAEKEVEDKIEKISKKKYNILIAEDNAINRKFINALLKSDLNRYNLFFAENGEEALKILEEQEIDLILMDIQMPVMDGMEATRRIRQNNKYNNLPIIALTAHALVGDKEKFISIGCNDYLTKPFNKKDLFDMLEKYLES